MRYLQRAWPWWARRSVDGDHKVMMPLSALSTCIAVDIGVQAFEESAVDTPAYRRSMDGGYPNPDAFM